LTATERCRKLLTEKDHAHFVRIICDQWSQAHVKKSEWNEGLAVYTRGLKLLPGDSHLTRNAVVTWNQWASGFIKKKEWGEAIKIYDRALEQFPRERTLRNNLKYCLQQAGK
jgi:pentatricopeptide repeat protein